MSIIYDALKKVEKSHPLNLTGKIDKVEKPKIKPKPRPYLIYTLVTCLGGFLVSVYWNILHKPPEINPQISSKIEPEVAKKPELEKKPGVTLTQELPKETAPPAINPSVASVPEEPKPQEPKKELKDLLVLNGVFFSGDEVYALVNNRIVREGDLIEGAIVKRIGLNEVELEFEGKIIQLSTNK